MLFKALLPSAFLAAALFGRATAQIFHTSSIAPVSTAAVDACILSCVESVATASGSGCSSATDISCICSSTSIQSNIASCVLKQCPSSDLAAAQALQSQECAAGEHRYILPVSISMPSSPVTETISIPSSAATVSSSFTPNKSSTPAPSSPEALLSASSASSALSSAESASSAASSAEHSSSSAAGTSASANASIKAGGGELYGGVMGIVVALIGAIAGAGLVM